MSQWASELYGWTAHDAASSTITITFGCAQKSLECQIPLPIPVAHLDTSVRLKLNMDQAPKG